MAFGDKSISQRLEERNVWRVCEVDPDAHFEGSKAYFSFVIFQFPFSILMSDELYFVVVEQETLIQIWKMENGK